jgi:hypothetical protein
MTPESNLDWSLDLRDDGDIRGRAERSDRDDDQLTLRVVQARSLQSALAHFVSRRREGWLSVLATAAAAAIANATRVNPFWILLTGAAWVLLALPEENR